MRLIFSCLLLLASNLLHADERILEFHSEIIIYTDSSMMVTETIKVHSEQGKIKRGIYRDFPTTYRDRLGNRYKVVFEPLEVKRNGSTESWHTKKISDGIRTYFGRSNRTIARGEHTYTFIYRTSRQLGFYGEHDELYWNVTGNNWAFPIDKASATVILPVTVAQDDLAVEAYTGVTGNTGRDYYTDFYTTGTVSVIADRKLRAREGLTIVVGWPKGIITEPGIREQAGYVLRDNTDLMILAGGLLLLLLYYLYVWHRVGRDPEAGVIIARYGPPKNYSPAALRFIEKMGYDKTCFATAIINLAVKGYLRIEEDNDGDYVLERLDKKVKMSAGEKALTDALFGAWSRVELKQANHERIKAALDAHEMSIKNRYETEYFISNSSWFFLGLFITVVVLISAILSGTGSEEILVAAFMTVWLSIWSLVVIGLVVTAWRSWKGVNGVARFVNALSTTLFACAFGFFEVVGIWMFSQATSLTFVFGLLLFVTVNWIFYQLLKAPTRAGRRLLDKVDGFRRYIEVAEKQELDYKHPQGRCPELFEEYLPFALALGIEQQWGEQFADVLREAQLQENYRPGWYSGTSFDTGNMDGFTSSIGSSLTSSVSTSSTAPGSSSGGGGGGFSGGGGGGGGGGGW